MRKVTFKAYAKINGSYEPIEGEGLFHSWGTELLETNESCCSYSIAIVEATDGTVYTCDPKDIKFIKP